MECLVKFRVSVVYKIWIWCICSQKLG